MHRWNSETWPCIFILGAPYLKYPKSCVVRKVFDWMSVRSFKVKLCIKLLYVSHFESRSILRQSLLFSKGSSSKSVFHWFISLFLAHGGTFLKLGRSIICHLHYIKESRWVTCCYRFYGWYIFNLNVYTFLHLSYVKCKKRLSIGIHSSAVLFIAQVYSNKKAILGQNA